MGPYTIDISFDEVLRMTLELTPHQRRTLMVAVQNGYYDFPRKTRLSVLAKKLKVKPSSLSETMRYAERKVMASFTWALDQAGQEAESPRNRGPRGSPSS
jgi:predicted DNA binding protein